MADSFCVVCRRRIASGSRCKRHRIASPSSRSWHQPGAADVRRRVLERDGHRCTRCGTAGDLQVHHRIGAAEGGPLSMDNLVVLCRQHHLEAEAAKERAT